MIDKSIIVLLMVYLLIVFKINIKTIFILGWFILIFYFNELNYFYEVELPKLFQRFVVMGGGEGVGGRGRKPETENQSDNKNKNMEQLKTEIKKRKTVFEFGENMENIVFDKDYTTFLQKNMPSFGVLNWMYIKPAWNEEERFFAYNKYCLIHCICIHFVLFVIMACHLTFRNENK